MGGWESGPMGVNGVNDGRQGNDSPAFGPGKVNANCPSPQIWKDCRSEFTKTRHFKRKLIFFWGGGLAPSPDPFVSGPPLLVPNQAFCVSENSSLWVDHANLIFSIHNCTPIRFQPGRPTIVACDWITSKLPRLRLKTMITIIIHKHSYARSGQVNYYNNTCKKTYEFKTMC